MNQNTLNKMDHYCLNLHRINCQLLNTSIDLLQVKRLFRFPNKKCFCKLSVKFKNLIKVWLVFMISKKLPS